MKTGLFIMILGLTFASEGAFAAIQNQDSVSLEEARESDLFMTKKFGPFKALLDGIVQHDSVRSTEAQTCLVLTSWGQIDLQDYRVQDFPTMTLAIQETLARTFELQNEIRNLPKGPVKKPEKAGFNKRAYPIYIYDKSSLLFEDIGTIARTSYGEVRTLRGVGDVTEVTGKFSSMRNFISFSDRPLFMKEMGSQSVVISKTDVVVEEPFASQALVIAPRILLYDRAEGTTVPMKREFDEVSLDSCVKRLHKKTVCLEQLEKVADHLRGYLKENPQPSPGKVAAIQVEAATCM